MKIGIYKITSPSGKVYIGQSINIDKRFKNYKYLSCQSQVLLYNSLLKYGVNNHKFEVLELCEKQNLDSLEKFYIDENIKLGTPLLNLNKANVKRKGKKLVYISRKEDKTIYCYDKQLTSEMIFDNYNDAVKHFNCKKSCIYDCCVGRLKSYLGYIFSFNRRDFNKKSDLIVKICYINVNI